MATTRPTVRPSGWWYLAPVAAVAVGLVVGVMTLVGGFREAQTAGFDAALAGPGESQLLTITESGPYTVAYTGPVVVSNETDQRTLVEDLDVSIAPVDGGEALMLDPYDGLNDLQQDEAQYVPLLTVRFEEAGDYTFSSSRAAGLDPERSRLVVLESPWRKLREGATRAVIIVSVALALALLVVVILARTRGRAKRMARASTPQPWPSPALAGYGATQWTGAPQPSVPALAEYGGPPWPGGPQSYGPAPGYAGPAAEGQSPGCGGHGAGDPRWPSPAMAGEGGPQGVGPWEGGAQTVGGAQSNGGAPWDAPSPDREGSSPSHGGSGAEGRSAGVGGGRPDAGFVLEGETPAQVGPQWGGGSERSDGAGGQGEAPDHGGSGSGGSRDHGMPPSEGAPRGRPPSEAEEGRPGDVTNAETARGVGRVDGLPPRGVRSEHDAARPGPPVDGRPPRDVGSEG